MDEKTLFELVIGLPRSLIIEKFAFDPEKNRFEVLCNLAAPRFHSALGVPHRAGPADAVPDARHPTGQRLRTDSSQTSGLAR